jgi:hypothetical protein
LKILYIKYVKKNTKGGLQHPFNQFFKILLCESYRQIALLCKLGYFHKHFLFPAQPGFGKKLVLDELIDVSIWLELP